MKKWKIAVKDIRGEGYIDVVVLVFCAMLVIALAVRVLPVYITKLQLDNFAAELVREAEIYGGNKREGAHAAGKDGIDSYSHMVEGGKHSAEPGD